jgi:hypothetical protein
MIVLLNKYIIVNLLFLFLLFFTFTISHLNTIVSIKDDEFFRISPENYYDPRDYGYGEENISSFSDQLDEIDSNSDSATAAAVVPTDNEQNNTLSSSTLITDDDNFEKSTSTSIPTSTPSNNSLYENYSNDVDEDDDINFIAAGDWNCNKETQKTIKKITKLQPELVLGLGDYTYQNISPQCWFDISEPIDEIMKIAIGNHDLDYLSSYYQLLDHYNLQQPYYSFNFHNIHFLAISSEHPYEEGSKQYKFIKNDLEESLQNPSILWRIVFLHKPMYTSADFSKNAAEHLKNTFHELFEEYKVNLVLSGHTQYYQRSLPLSYNKDNSFYPVVMDQNSHEYNNQDGGGVIFITAGTAGDALHKISYSLPYYVIQEQKFGFLNFDLKNNGYTLIGTFYDTDDLDIVDKFKISKDNHGEKTYFEDDKDNYENDYDNDIESDPFDDKRYHFLEID